jgi:hypothetical protein
VGDVSIVVGVQISPLASGCKLGLCYKRKAMAPLQKRKRGNCAGDFARLCQLITYLSLTEKTNMRKAKIKRF